MKIALVVNAAWNLYNFRLKLLETLQAEGHEIHLIAPQDAYSDRLQEKGFTFHPLLMSAKGVNPVQDLGLLRRLRSLYKNIGPDVILQFTIKPNIYGSIAARSLGIPVINNVTGLGTAFIRPGIVNRVVRLLYTFAFQKALVFFQNNDDKQLFLDLGLVKAHQVKVIPGSGVDLQKFRPVAPAPEKSSAVFLMIARILRDKGIVEYLEAARIIRQKFPASEFRLIGAFDEVSSFGIKRSVVEQAVAEGVLIYKEFTDAIVKEIHEADVVVLPSYREGMPRTLLEAAACGKPLIATDAPGCRDVVKDGVNGFLCRPKDVPSLVEAMQQFIALTPAEQARMGKESRKLVEQHYDETFVIEAYRKAIKDVVK